MTFLYISYVMLIIGTIALVFYPEAPRYLVKSDRIEEAVIVLQGIAAANGVDDFEKVSKSRIESVLAMREEIEPISKSENEDSSKSENEDSDEENDGLLKSIKANDWEEAVTDPSVIYYLR